MFVLHTADIDKFPRQVRQDGQAAEGQQVLHEL